MIDLSIQGLGGGILSEKITNDSCSFCCKEEESNYFWTHLSFTNHRVPWESTELLYLTDQIVSYLLVHVIDSADFGSQINIYIFFLCIHEYLISILLCLLFFRMGYTNYNKMQHTWFWAKLDKKLSKSKFKISLTYSTRDGNSYIIFNTKYRLGIITYTFNFDKPSSSLP